MAAPAPAEPPPEAEAAAGWLTRRRSAAVSCQGEDRDAKRPARRRRRPLLLQPAVPPGVTTAAQRARLRRPRRPPPEPEPPEEPCGADPAPAGSRPWCYSLPEHFAAPIPGSLAAGGSLRPHMALASCPWLTSAFCCGELGTPPADAQALSRTRFRPAACQMRQWRAHFRRLLRCHLRGRRIIFAGDSITGQHFAAFACLARAAVPPVSESPVWEPRWDPDGTLCGTTEADCGNTLGDFLVAAGAARPGWGEAEVLSAARSELREKLKLPKEDIAAADPQRMLQMVRRYSMAWGLRCPDLPHGEQPANVTPLTIAGAAVRASCVRMVGPRAGLKGGVLRMPYNVSFEFARVLTLPPNKLGLRGAPMERLVGGRVLRKLGLHARDIVVANSGLWWDPFVPRDRRLYTQGMLRVAGLLRERSKAGGGGPLFLWRESTPQFFAHGPGGLWPALSYRRRTEGGCLCRLRWTLAKPPRPRRTMPPAIARLPPDAQQQAAALFRKLVGGDSNASGSGSGSEDVPPQPGEERRMVEEPDGLAMEDNDTGDAEKPPRIRGSCGMDGGCCPFRGERSWCFTEPLENGTNCSKEWDYCEAKPAVPFPEERRCGPAPGGFDNWRNEAANAALRRAGIPILHLWNLTTQAPLHAVMSKLTRSDCSHFCQPGIPEVWADLLFSALHYL
eukprot:TRINITY_DN40613_c0_g1_i1.p1 TRINITY_DN40613_c0_g1~~TRINITY_DN40613_c0_g1_i1.p1  ORF type:complete len:705 (+),score=148.46 TRINITY_DN40613_c0_g1_i1:92-2116(+)